MSSSPYSCSIRSDDWRSDATDASIHVAVAVRCDSKCLRKSVSLFDKDLVTNAPAGWVKVDVLASGESLYGRVFRQILVRLVLYVVVECKNSLTRIEDARGPDCLESAKSESGLAKAWSGEHKLGDDGAGIIVAHDMFWTNHDIVSCSNSLSRRQAQCISLHYFFDERLRPSRICYRCESSDVKESEPYCVRWMWAAHRARRGRLTTPQCLATSGQPDLDPYVVHGFNACVELVATQHK